MHSNKLYKYVLLVGDSHADYACTTTLRVQHSRSPFSSRVLWTHFEPSVVTAEAVVFKGQFWNENE